MVYIIREAEKILSKMLTSPKVAIVLGARQVGKTTLVEHVLANKKSLFLNLDIDTDKQKLITAAAFSPQDVQKSFGQPEIIVIDEAQRLPETGRIVKGWYDSKLPFKIILLGSSSLDILNQSAESLTGRNEKLFLPPLLFREIVADQSWYSETFNDEMLHKNFSNQLEALLLQNIVFGNYPEIVQSENKQMLLLGLVSDFLLKDILQLGLIKSSETIRRLLVLLAYQVGGEVSISELAVNLNISRQTVEQYLDLLEQTFVIFRLRSFSTNPRKEINKSQKIYFWDTGIRNAVLNEFSLNKSRPDIGALWENWVIAEFAKQNFLSGRMKNLYFWRSRTGGEVDLVIKDGREMRAIEVKWNADHPNKSSFFAKYKTETEVINKTRPLVKI